MHKNTVVFVIATIILSACAPTAEQIATPVFATIAAISTATPYPTHTLMPSQTPLPTYTPYPTYTLPSTQTPKIIIVTPTGTQTPAFTPTETLPPTATLDPLFTDKGAGFYLVGIDIAPGLWRSQGKGEKCYWSITTKTGDIIDNHYGMAGGTMYISTSGFQVELKDACGTWVYLGQ